MFGQPSAGEHLLPLAAAMALSCYQSTLGGVLNGVGRPGSHAMADLICDGIQLAFTFTVGLPGWASAASWRGLWSQQRRGPCSTAGWWCVTPGCGPACSGG